MSRKGLQAALLTASLAVLLAGCEQLGLDDDEETAAPPPVVVPPDLIVPEPLEPMPVPRVLFYKGLDFNDPDNPVDFVFSYLIASRSVLRQSSGLSATVKSQPLPLGSQRFSHGYVVVHENNRFFLGATDTDVLTQLSTFDLPLCANDSYRIVSDGVGFVNSHVVAFTPGADAVCDTVDDAYYRIDLDAQPTDGYTASSAFAYRGVAVQDPFWSLAGFFVAEGSSVALRQADSTLVRSFDNLADTAVSSPLRNGSELIFALDGSLYDTTSEALAANEPLTARALLNRSVLDNELSLVDGNALYTVDEQQVKRIDLADGSVLVLADLQGTFTPSGRMQASQSYLWIKGTDESLYRIHRETGAVETVIADTVGSFLVAGERLYVSVFDPGASPDKAVFRAKQAAVDGPIPGCANEEGRGVDDEGCFSNSRWIIADRYGEAGVTRVPLRLAGKETTTTIRDEDGNESPITNPAQYGIYLNSPDLLVYETQTGLQQIDLGGISGYVRLEQTGVIDIVHGLFSIVTLADGQESMPDVVYFNTNTLNSFRVVARTPQVEEGLIAVSTD